MTKRPSAQVEADGAGHPTKDRPLDPFRVPKTDAARTVVAEVTRQLQALEQHHGLRKRARRPADQARFEGAVAAIVCDLIHRHLTEPTGWVSVSVAHDELGRVQRYATPTTTKTLTSVIEHLARHGMDFLRVEKGRRAYFDYAAAFLRPEAADPALTDFSVPVVASRRTVLQAGPRLVKLIHDQSLAEDDLGRDDTGEVLVLRAEKVDGSDQGKAVDYDDTPTTRRYRDEMRGINEWIEAADLQLLLPDKTYGTVRQAGELTVDTDNRRLYRGFTRGSFKSGGRLHGGFWQSMKGRMRHEWLRIDGEPVVTVDFATMSARIVYALAGLKPTWTDAYAFPGLESHRDGAKLVFNAALFATKRFTRFPGEAHKKFPGATTVSDVVAAMLKLHAPVASALFRGKGHEVQFIESEILIDALLALNAKGIVALPVHDALIVAEARAEDARQAMMRAFKDYTKADGLVRIEKEG